MKDYLYLALVGRGVYKIGVSNTVPKRVREQGYTLLRDWYRPADAFMIEALVKALMCNAGYKSRPHNSREHFACRRADIDAAIECALMVADGKRPRDVLVALSRIDSRQGHLE